MELNKIGREVELLAEIAELQLKLIEKLGRKANLQNFESVLSDPITNQIRISQENVVKSIKNEVYKKNNEKTRKILSEFSKDIQVIQNAKTLTAETEVDFRTGTQLFTSLMADLRQDMKRVSSYRRCTSGTVP